MILLAIETATPTGGAALWRDGAIVASIENDGAATHSERLMPAIDTLLCENDIALGDLDAFAVSIGPGSFTGLRIGLAVAKALAHATEKPIVAVSTLEALAWRFAKPGQLAAPMLDARRHEIFAALFSRSEPNGPLERITPDVAERPEIFAKRIESPCVAGGPGAERYADLLAQQLGERIEFVDPAIGRASPCAVAALAAEKFARGETADLLTLQPTYVRKSDAELALGKRKSQKR